MHVHDAATLHLTVQDATWAGNIEVQAASVCFGCNVHIYQQGQACWRTVNFTPPEHQPCLHLSYHDGDHYNSVRLQSDAGGGPPEHIDLTACHVAPEVGAADDGGVRCSSRAVPHLAPQGP